MFRFLKRLLGKDKNRRAPYNPEAEFVVEVDDRLVRCTRPNGEVEQVDWEDLRAVILETNDTGPIGMDVLWILVGTDSGCVIPQGARGEDALIRALQRLPGFDNEAMIRASTSVENRQFLCWEKE